MIGSYHLHPVVLTERQGNALQKHIRQFDPDRRLLKQVRKCQKHGLVSHQKRTDNSGWRCSKCNTEHVHTHRVKKKEILILELGGSCILCGYNKYIGSLHFHHIDPRTKKFGLGKINLASSLSKLREEVKKCILVCSNCHGEIHAGLHPDLVLQCSDVALSLEPIQ